MRATPAMLLLIARDLREADPRAAHEARHAADRAARRHQPGLRPGNGFLDRWLADQPLHTRPDGLRALGPIVR
jgi:hypothetical protein